MRRTHRTGRTARPAVRPAGAPPGQEAVEPPAPAGPAALFPAGPAAQAARFPVGMVMGVVFPEDPLLRNSIASARTNWSNM